MMFRSLLAFLFVALLCASADAARRHDDELRLQRDDPAGRQEEEQDEQWLKPREAIVEFESEAGRIETWASEFPALRRAGFEAARITVNSGGLALPVHYNSHVIKALVEGSGVIGLVTENAGSLAQKSLFQIKKGDVVVVPRGVACWFFNNGEETAQLVGMAYYGRDTDRFRQFQMLGGTPGFSSRVLAHAWNVLEQTVRQLLERYEKQDRIIKVSKESMLGGEQSVLNFGASQLIHRLGHDVSEAAVRHAGEIKELNSEKMLALKSLDMSARCLRLERDAMYAPNYIHNGDKLIYVVKGSADLEIVSSNGQRVVQETVREGQLVLVPRGFPHVEVARNESYESFAVINAERPINSYFAGVNGIWNRIPRGILSATFGMREDDVEKLLTSRERDEGILFPSAREQRRHDE